MSSPQIKTPPEGDDSARDSMKIAGERHRPIFLLRETLKSELPEIFQR